MQNKTTLLIILTSCALLSAASVNAELLQDCFHGSTHYNIDYSFEIPSSENIAGSIINDHKRMLGQPTTMEASCNCPPNMRLSSNVRELTAAGSPLPAGASGYGYLTEYVDVNVSGYSEAINSPNGTNLIELKINEYPTSPDNRARRVESNFDTTEATASVCNDVTRPEGGTNTKRQFRWNVMSMKLYIKKPILGEEVIPMQTVVEYFACLSSDDDGACNSSNAVPVSTISLGGTITAPLSCTINAGSTIEIEMGNIVSSQFIAQGQPPAGYTLKNVDIDYHCDAPAVSNSNKIRLSLTADQGVSDTDNRVIAKMLDRDDLGVRMFDENSKSVILDGTVDFDVPLDSDGNGSIHLKAAPVSTTNKKPEPGKFEGNVTIKMDLR
ncbi:fimbrial protein [Scandinavium sp. V105_16]|uniref:Fimbrial protein n=1 Tax=Scandinavium lactucae TaxID=3095028 RepID=A0AAJ2VTW0_9ENTR|nr:MULTISPECIES: fimbrial protein [unclassified Scandinavium]MDX6019942.1 fimbrial protein [Scandinavium sp. V105_16]MDX6031243.1 fimbrial protein [Scandinavium sp. V105_12]